jgi:hypothetical protein
VKRKYGCSNQLYVDILSEEKQVNKENCLEYLVIDKGGKVLNV